MAQTREQKPQQPQQQQGRKKPEGDVIGISQTEGDIPRATPDRGGHPKGIDVGQGRRERDDPPATSDVGAGGSGTTIKNRD